MALTLTLPPPPFMSASLVRSLYNNIVPPSRLGHGADFHLFKEGVEPKWEDAKCATGGKWTANIPKTPNSKQLLDTYWLHTVPTLTVPTSLLILPSQVGFPCPLSLSYSPPPPSPLTQLLAIIGEQFTEGEDICGVVVSVRNKQDRVSLWTSTASNEAAQTSLGKEFKSVLDIPDRQTMGFMAHVRSPRPYSLSNHLRIEYKGMISKLWTMSGPAIVLYTQTCVIKQAVDDIMKMHTPHYWFTLCMRHCEIHRTAKGSRLRY